MKKTIFKIMLGAAFATLVAINMVQGQDPISFPGSGGIGGSSKGTLKGNSGGTFFCCDPGTNDCSAAKCE